MDIAPGWRHGVYGQGKWKAGIWLFSLAHLKDLNV